MVSIEPNHIPQSPKELYKIIVETYDPREEMFSAPIRWENLESAAKDRYTLIFNKLYKTNLELPPVDSLVSVELRLRPDVWYLGIVKEHTLDKLKQDTISFVCLFESIDYTTYSRRIFGVDEITGLIYFTKPFEARKTLWQR